MKKITDHLWTARWAVSQNKNDIAHDEITSALQELGALPKEIGMTGPELPSAESVNPINLGLIVGHTRSAPGATMHGGQSEYSYNSEVAQIAKSYGSKYSFLTTHIIFRDGVGIAGAYRRANELKCDAVIELHFNAFNRQVVGTETLIAPGTENRKFAQFIHDMQCRVFERGGQSRGVKVLSRGQNGFGNVSSFPQGPNCLPEPFFGDTPSEAVLANTHKQAYAQGLVEASLEYFKSEGLV
jgi:N-acetylmuramoyl-L-alanine amidase